MMVRQNKLFGIYKGEAVCLLLEIIVVPHVVGVWETVSDSQTGHSWKMPRWLGFLMKGLAVVICCSWSKCGHTNTHMCTYKYIHMLALLSVTTSSGGLPQWKVPAFSAKLLTRAKELGDWGGRKEREGKVERERRVRLEDKRSKELSTFWGAYRTQCLCEAVSYRLHWPADSCLDLAGVWLFAVVLIFTAYNKVFTNCKDSKLDLTLSNMTRVPHSFLLEQDLICSKPQKNSEFISGMCQNMSHRQVLTVTQWWTSSLMMSEIPKQLLCAVIIASLLSTIKINVEPVGKHINMEMSTIIWS